MSAAWLASNSFGSLLDTVLEGAMNVPLRQAIRVVSGGGAVGSEVHETDARPMFKLSLDTETGVPEQHVMAMVAVTAELLRMGGPLADKLIDGELQRALRRAQDIAVLNAIAPNVSPAEIDVIAAVGTTPTTAWVDLRKLVEALATDAQSRIVLGVSPLRAKRMSLWVSTTGERAFPDVTIAGGTIKGMAVTVSDRIADDEVVAIDPSGIAGSAGSVVADIASHASIEFETEPDNPTGASTVMTNLWQRNMKAIQLKRKFGIKRIRAGSVAKLDNVVWNNPA
jgi:HK97 family phage major capsid protein